MLERLAEARERALDERDRAVTQVEARAPDLSAPPRLVAALTRLGLGSSRSPLVLIVINACYFFFFIYNRF